MRYLDDKLCLEYDDLVPEVMTMEAYNKARYRGNIVVHGRGGNGSQVLVEYDSLSDGHKAKVSEIYGDVYEYAAKQPILDAITPSPEAETYYRNYTLPNGSKLPATDTDINGKAQINYVKRYTQNAEWLDMMVRMTLDKCTLKQELNISLGTFWDTCTDLIKVKKVSLPTNSRRLREKVDQYQNEGYDCLVEAHKFGNCNSEKVADEEAKALLLKMICHKNNFDDTYICATYNNWAKETGRECITPAAVTYRRKQWKGLIELERTGVQKTSAKLSKQIKRHRATAPLLLINSDDNVLDAYFNAGKGREYYRPVLYVVIDTFNDYILGYAWGDTVTKDLVKEAYRDAHRHVRKITGDAYCWQQLQTDRWAISGKNTTELEHFYNSMGTFTPAAVNNAQSKYIERTFGVVWQQNLKACFLDSYSGANITSKSQINREALDHRLFPDISEADRMIDAFIWTMRMTMRTSTGMTRHEEWVEAFKASEKSKAKLLSDEQRLQIFGKLHSHVNQIKGHGLNVTLLGQQMNYELSQKDIFEHIGKRVQVYYDEGDLSQVLMTDGKGLRMVVNEWKTVPAAFADYEAGDSEKIKQLQDEKRTLLPMINKVLDARDRVLDRARIDAESLLQAGVLLKGINHEAQRIYTSNTSQISTSKGWDNAENVTETTGVRADNNAPETFKKPLKPVKRDIYDDM